MCGIVGLYLKNSKLENKLGEHISAMLVEMTGRGPDSAGIAVYRRPAPAGFEKFTLYHIDPSYDWTKLAGNAQVALGDASEPELIDNHCILNVKARSSDFIRWLKEDHPDVRVVGVGTTIEVFKEVGLPKEVLSRFDIAKLAGTHALGHTRMATESAVTTAGSHPFSVGDDLCLVHNGSLSNHSRLRSWLEQRGLEFQTENDTEVAAGYFTHKISEGATLKDALEAGLNDLDGFYTFVVGTRDGFAVVRDPIACKPAVMAETDDYVAFASEYHALVELPGINQAKVWEPEPAVVYSWGGRA